MTLLFGAAFDRPGWIRAPKAADEAATGGYPSRRGKSGRHPEVEDTQLTVGALVQVWPMLPSWISRPDLGSGPSWSLSLESWAGC